MTRNLLLYVLVMLAFGAGIGWVLDAGSRLRPPDDAAIVTTPVAGPATATAQAAPPHRFAAGLLEMLRDNFHQPLSILLFQVIVVVMAARMLGSLVQRLGQPAVVGEMAAGILLGPSFLGLHFPAVQGLIFPAASLGGLQLLSQVGVILFLFVVGLDLDLAHLRNQAHAALLVSHVSIIIPLFLGVALSLFIFPALGPAHGVFLPFALFIGVAMSITAFPVLVRILEERGMTRSFLGATAITCAAVGDATAWCLLALVVAIAGATGWWSAAVTMVLVLLFSLLMLFGIMPLATRWVERRLQDAAPGNGWVAYTLAFVFAAALITELIGIHALFGAFLAGVALSGSEPLRVFLKERLESFSSVFLLPLFFAFTGLRTQIGLLAGWQSWAMCAAIVGVAIAGKLGGTLFAARWTGMGWRDSFSLGALMNTRGLVELIVLNLGYDLGILPPRIFAMMVLMALITTVMTGPLLDLAEYYRRRETMRR